jgi:hypothetical protein
MNRTGLSLTRVVAAATATVAGCAALAPPPAPGQSEAEVLKRFGTPTGRYALAHAAQRLEFATGPFGRETWMVDLDAAGRVTAAVQVLTDTNLADFQSQLARRPLGARMSREELLRTLGRPGERRSGGWQGGEVWSWRYPTNDCLWFQVSIGDDGFVRDGAFGTDPTCDAPSDRN